MNYQSFFDFNVLQVTLYKKKIKNLFEYRFFMSTIKFCFDKILLKQFH